MTPLQIETMLGVAYSRIFKGEPAYSSSSPLVTIVLSEEKHYPGIRVELHRGVFYCGIFEEDRSFVERGGLSAASALRYAEAAFLKRQSKK